MAGRVPHVNKKCQLKYLREYLFKYANPQQSLPSITESTSAARAFPPAPFHQKGRRIVLQPASWLFPHCCLQTPSRRPQLEWRPFYLYRSIGENVPIALLHIPHQPMWPKIEPVAKSLIEYTNYLEGISKWWYPAASATAEYPHYESTSLSLEPATMLHSFITNRVSTRKGEYKLVRTSSLSHETLRLQTSIALNGCVIRYC
jgi:hypothetical protein